MAETNDSQPSFRRVKNKPKQLRRIENEKKAEIVENIEVDEEVV